MDSLKPMLVGPTALAFVKGDAAMAAKALNDAARQFNLLEFKGGVLNGSTLSADDVRSIARLPAREVLYAQLVGTVAAPLTGLARGLNALIAGLAIQLQAIVDMDPPALVSGEAPAAAEPEPAAVEPEPEPEAAAAEPEPEAEPEAAAAEPEPEAAAAEPEAPAEPEASQDTETEAASDAAPSDE
jgi:large subunit ribosomal protein L10